MASPTSSSIIGILHLISLGHLSFIISFITVISWAKGKNQKRNFEMLHPFEKN